LFRGAASFDEHQMQRGFEDLDADIARAEVTLPSKKARRARRDSRPSLPAHLTREEMRLHRSIRLALAVAASCM
jgi:transposase